MAEYTLRALAAADYDAVYALWQQTEGMGLGESDTREAITAFLQRNCGLSAIACDAEGSVLGAVLCGHDGRRGYLHHLAVARTHRKGGIGRALVNSCLEKLAALGIVKCTLLIFATNTAGREFWAAQGWTARDDIVIVQKELKPSRSNRSCSC